MKKNLDINDIASCPQGDLAEPSAGDLAPLPPPYDEEPAWKRITDEQRGRLVCNLDGFIGMGLPRPESPEQERAYVEKFVAGLKKLLSRDDNWAFLQPLLLSLDYCARCQTCVSACPVYEESGRADLYRPTYRSEVFRRLVNRYAAVRPAPPLRCS